MTALDRLRHKYRVAPRGFKRRAWMNLHQENIRQLQRDNPPRKKKWPTKLGMCL